MLDSETKRRIDTARDILVGKLPDPKSQIEQITIALIYKFMDDMDKESEELGGKSLFFSGEFSKYSWSKIFDPRISGFEMFGLYSESISRMSQNPKIPQLFRDIFKNAYLPYRDPETLKAFLKVINDFTYDHSEKLGDAFEYLLSVMGSQGDAGQFRTPRHIIDFIVKVVDPDKNDTVLDPACGTAGFLISAYKHIVQKYKDKEGKTKLTPDERKRLVSNFMGYDISPDMVRLSLVNLYLHGFQNPHIYEYDTLTSEERWNEVYDVVIANPPFMTPKGGIKPHKRFSIQANRSEVLFVDYIAEHLNPNGRAGIIVPEGIIFQSGTAYQALRKMLLEHSLYAVVSLPAGVFNPYSGVKTSVLLMDKNLVKKSNKLLFVKVANDGFGLGAQRREVKGDELPLALDIIHKFRNSILSGKECTLTDLEKRQSLIVEKKDLSDDLNLSGDRYRVGEVYSGKFELVDFEDLLNEVEYSNKIKKGDFLEKGNFPIIDQSEKYIAGFWNRPQDVFKITTPVIIFGDHTRIFKYINFDFVLGADGVKILEPKDNVNPRFLYFLLNSIKIKNLGYSRHYKELKGKKLPLPPLEVQEQIVAELESYQKIVDGAKQVVESYKPSFKVEKEWQIVNLGDISEIISGQSPESKYYNREGEGTPFYQGKTEFGDRYLGPPVNWTSQITKLAEKNDILMSVRAPVGPINFSTEEICIGRGLAAIRPHKFIEKIYLFTYLASIQDKIRGNGGAVFDSISREQIGDIKIPLPPLETQKQIVAKIEEEQKLVDANKKLIEIFEQKIKDKIAEVWGENNGS